jgi:tyrosine-specific transport protein
MDTITTTIDNSQSAEITDRSFWIVTLLVSGTCIGGGMLALPVQTATSGFLYSFFALSICWAFMTYTGLLLVEATMWVKSETHFTSLSRILIGNGTRILAMTVYLFMNYLSLIAYTAGGAALFQNQIAENFALNLSYEICCILFVALFGSLIYLGAILVGRINFLFMIGLGLCYFCLMSLSASHVNFSRLSYSPDWRESLRSFSIILAAFSYQMVVPSICMQLNYNAKKTKKAISVGTTIPFLIYSAWLLIVHGVVPIEGDNGLLDALSRGASTTEPLRAQFNHWSLTVLTDMFAFFAIVTSFLGLSLALFYFLKDCFKEMNIRMSKNAIILTSIIPTVLLAMLFPKALVQCLDLSGAYGDTILSGVIPIAMVWIGRYKKNLSDENRTPGGRIVLLTVAGFYIFIFLWQSISARSV